MKLLAILSIVFTLPLVSRGVLAAPHNQTNLESIRFVVQRTLATQKKQRLLAFKISFIAEMSSRSVSVLFADVLTELSSASNTTRVETFNSVNLLLTVSLALFIKVEAMHLLKPFIVDPVIQSLDALVLSQDSKTDSFLHRFGLLIEEIQTAEAFVARKQARKQRSVDALIRPLKDYVLEKGTKTICMVAAAIKAKARQRLDGLPKKMNSLAAKLRTGINLLNKFSGS